MNEVHLASALHFQLNRGLNQIRLKRRDHGLNRQPIFRRRLNHRHIAQPKQRHVQRARDRRGAHGEHVDAGLDLFQPLFMFDPEALLFIDDHEAKVFELDVLREYPVRADCDIYLARRNVLDGHLNLLRIAEAREHINPHRERLEALLKSFEMLERQAPWSEPRRPLACHRQGP